MINELKDYKYIIYFLHINYKVLIKLGNNNL